MILPTIHSNGTGPDDLLAGYRAAMDAMDAARSALGEIEFNARDYYIQGEDAWPKAQAQRQAMFLALENIKDELLAHAEVAFSAVFARDERRTRYSTEVQP